LICTPSNGAIDEILRRLKTQGVYGNAQAQNQVTRVGASQYVAPLDVADFDINSKCQQLAINERLKQITAQIDRNNTALLN
jgi:hypothetical protein